MARSSKSKGGTAKRREDLRRNLPKPSVSLLAIVRRPELVRASAVLLSMMVLVSWMVIWSRDQIKVDAKQTMTETRLKRLDYRVEDPDETAQAREQARAESPAIYRPNTLYLEELRAALNGLPQAVAGMMSLEEVAPELVASFTLNEAGLVALQPWVKDGQPDEKWQRYVDRLIDDKLPPILENEDFQQFTLASNRALLQPDGRLENAIPGVPVRLGAERDEETISRLRDAIVLAGFDDDVTPHILARLLDDPQPTLRFDPDETKRRGDLRADQEQPRFIEHRRGEVLYRRGQMLDRQTCDAVATEAKQYRNLATAREVWVPRAGTAGLLVILLGLAGAAVGLSSPAVLRNVWRVLAIAVLMSAMLAVTIGLTTGMPWLLYPAAVGPTLFAAIILLLAYEQRLALFLTTIQCCLVTIALEQSVGWLILLLVGCGTMIGKLRTVRTRNSIINAAVVTAAVFGAGTALLGFLELPNLVQTWIEITRNIVGTVSASLVVGFLMLGILPSIERLFDITTGMTLAELRDPSQPLLRQLQQRAPGTYNHSLQVANIAEAAADAIGADSMLVYVGGLYHDVGKLNKPEYFVENQAGGVNKHAKLRPAMSLLVIIGHVKDGIELAREYGLPRTIQHFIEAHHGTTLVEYFYHAAKTQAEDEGRDAVDEVEFRYPGPKPRTKEAAILMVADAVESATRAMTEPNPSRIESIVREIASKRLLDGQFDQCDLTFGELGLIEEAAIARLCAIHHGRISYPTSKTGAPAVNDADGRPAAAVS